MEIILENVRCFQGEHRISVTPITLLVGENSAGKSTFLAIMAALTNSTDFPFTPNFNSPPYELGNFENIATANRQKGSMRHRFELASVDLVETGWASEGSLRRTEDISARCISPHLP